MTFDYPESKQSDHVDDYHGTRIADPYRWLEASADTPEVRAWIEAQNELTFDYLGNLGTRGTLKKRLTELWDYPKRSAPFKKGGRYFQFRNDGLQNQDVLFVMDGLADEGRILLDPNTLSADGTVALSSVSVSTSGAFLAYATSGSGSDWQTWQVRDVATGEDLDEQIPWSKFSGATWLPDGSGFYYQRFPVPAEGAAYTGANANAELRFHALRSDPATDTLVFARPDQPKWMFQPKLSDDGRYLVLHVSRSTEQRNLVYYRDLEAGTDFQGLVTDWAASYTFLGNDGATFYFQTDQEADRGRIVAADLNTGVDTDIGPTDIGPTEKVAWRTVVPEREDTLEHALLLGNEFICLAMQDASHYLKRFSLHGEHRGNIDLPTLGSVVALNAERDDAELFYSFTSFLHPTTSYRYDAQTSRSETLYAPEIAFDPAPYTTRQVFATSPDGTRVPMFLVHRKDLEPDGQNPTLLYGYGGFNISLAPAFSVSRLVWLESGGVLATANLRGGGEYGKSWHEAGTYERKQNVFDDFIACAEHLISENITSPRKLAIQGGSNGGLLVGAAMTQRPELFAAALPAVGVMDMLRFHHFTIGWAWASDYGSADHPEQFEALLAYSPLHNLKEGTAYPATLVTTGDFDDRVVPAHSFKFAAALQRAHAGDSPALIRVQTKAGHGMGKPTRVLIEEQADLWAFLADALDTEEILDSETTSLEATERSG